MASIKELIQSIEAADSSFDEKLAAINQMEETLVAMRQQEEEAINDNVDLIVEAIKVMEDKVNAQLEIAKSIVPEKGDKGDKGKDGKDGKNGLDGKDGRDGRDGKDGIDGKDGVSVTDAKIDFDGSLIITFSTGQEVNVGEVVAPDLVEKIHHISTIGVTSGITSITSNDGSVAVTTGENTVDLSTASVIVGSTQNVVCQVRNSTGATLTKGTAVYISGATGQIPTVTKALATSDATSAQTLGLINADLANNSNGYVTIIGLITEIDTSTYTDGAQLYLSGTTAGTLTATKPYAPTHLVYVAVVEYAHPIHGKLFVKVQNGYELDEIHNVSAQSPSNGQTIIYNATTSLWEKANLTAGTGISVTNGAGSITVANTGVTSVTATAPVSSSGGATPTISLATGYGDTQNPYASKTANYFLAAPNGSAGAPTFRALVAADVPTLNQNTTGTASNVTGIVAIANGGTGATTLAGASIATYSGTETLSNKRIDPRDVTTTTATTLTPDVSVGDIYCYTALASGLTINAPIGTPTNGDKLIFRLLDNGTGRALTWNGTYTAIGVTLPTTTTANKTTYVGCIYNSNNTRWDVIAVTTQA